MLWMVPRDSIHRSGNQLNTVERDSSTTAKVRTVATSNGRTTRRMSRDLRRSREQRQKILEAASEIIASDTTGTVTLDDIAAKMGSSKGKIYYYFQSRGELLYHLHMYAADLAEDAIFPVFDDATLSPAERLQQVIYTHVLVICRHWRLWRCLWWDVNLRETPQDLARIVKRRNKEYLVKVASLIEEVNKSSSWPDVKPITLARILFDLINSVSRWYKDIGPLSADEVAAMVVRSAIGGLLSKSETGSASPPDRGDTTVAKSN